MRTFAVELRLTKFANRGYPREKHAIMHGRGINWYNNILYMTGKLYTQFHWLWTTHFVFFPTLCGLYHLNINLNLPIACLSYFDYSVEYNSCALYCMIL
jgi:hypothetical protein